MLERVRADHGVAIPLAIESGSRAWGFPSPDSDYDCRFLFVRSERDYLSLWRKRDVIEMPVDRVLDVNGWDIGKALKLLLKGNAVIIEWLTSPITYRTDPQFRDEFLELVRAVADRALIARHYLHLGERQRRTYFRDTKSVPQKKVFYALRPAAALRLAPAASGRSGCAHAFPDAACRMRAAGRCGADLAGTLGAKGPDARARLRAARRSSRPVHRS
jgi:predicted nucleotidyltransferase